MLGSVMLLATTNFLTQDVAPIPLLWVLPLCIYLLSFILTFHGTWYRRWLFHPLFAITALLVVLALFRGEDMRLTSQIAVYLVFLFVACMVCHGEVARLKPNARYLTSFYLLLSAGGAAGGIFVAIIAPSIFPTFWEYQLGLWAIALLLLVILFRDRTSWLHNPKPNLLVPIAALTLLLIVPKYLVHAAHDQDPSVALFCLQFQSGAADTCMHLARFHRGPNLGATSEISMVRNDRHRQFSTLNHRAVFAGQCKQ